MCRIIYHPKYSLYNLGAEHPFSPLRVEIMLDLLKELGLNVNIEEPELMLAEKLLSIHSEDYIKTVEAASNGETVDNLETFGLGTQDNPIVKGMAEGARYQVGGTIYGAKLLVEGKAQKVLQMGGGFHHAHRNFAAGFCIYNDLAAAIKEMTANGWHVAYLDLDVHHGDGVQEIFYDDGQVMTISIHESGEYLFPGSGWQHELGKGQGRSLKLNLPLEPFTEGESYLEAIERVVEPALSWFKPDALVVQAGADPHFSDPLADFMLTTKDFEKLYKKVIELADSYCGGKVLFTFGGGYSITATTRIWALLYLILTKNEIPELLPETWRSKWQPLMKNPLPKLFHDPNPAYEPIPRKPEIEKLNRELMRRLMDAVAPDWL